MPLNCENIFNVAGLTTVSADTQQEDALVDALRLPFSTIRKQVLFEPIGQWKLK